MPRSIARWSCEIALLFRCAEPWFTSRSRNALCVLGCLAVHIGGAPLESGHHFESQTIQRIQNVFGRTLRIREIARKIWGMGWRRGREVIVTREFAKSQNIARAISTLRVRAVRCRCPRVSG